MIPQMHWVEHGLHWLHYFTIIVQADHKFWHDFCLWLVNIAITFSLITYLSSKRAGKIPRNVETQNSIWPSAKIAGVPKCRIVVDVVYVHMSLLFLFKPRQVFKNEFKIMPTIGVEQSIEQALVDLFAAVVICILVRNEYVNSHGCELLLTGNVMFLSL